MKLFGREFKIQKIIKAHSNLSDIDKIMREEITEQDKRDTLIKTGRQQFQKLHQLGLQIPIGVL